MLAIFGTIVIIIAVAFVAILILAASDGEAWSISLFLVFVGFLGVVYINYGSKKEEPVGVVQVQPQPPPNPEPHKGFKLRSWITGEKEEKKVEQPVIEKKAEEPVVAKVPEAFQEPVQPPPPAAPEPPKEWKMPELPLLITVGSILFIVLSCLEFISLAVLFNYEQGPWAGVVFVASVVLLFMFSDLTVVGSYEYYAAHRIYFWTGLAAYIAIGIAWMFWRWDRYGIRQVRDYEKPKIEWLRERGHTADANVPDRLLEDWLLHVKGDPGGKELENIIQQARREWLRERHNRRVDLLRDQHEASSIGEVVEGQDYISGSYSAANKRRRKEFVPPPVPDLYNVSLEDEAEWVKFSVEDPLLETTKNPAVRSMQDARRIWLTANKVYDTHIIPSEYRDRFTRRIISNNYIVREPHPVLNALAEPPTVGRFRSKLVAWIIAWPVDAAVYLLKDLLWEFGVWLVDTLRGTLQRRMDAIYAPVRNDFRAPSDND